jgi:hypothetical protein
MKKKADWINAIGYVRTAVADPEGEQLNKQQSAIAKYCTEKDLNLLCVFVDNGASGNDYDRHGWTELII